MLWYCAWDMDVAVGVNVVCMQWFYCSVCASVRDEIRMLVVC
jgi:hypothetical protein